MKKILLFLLAVLSVFSISCSTQPQSTTPPTTADIPVIGANPAQEPSTTEETTPPVTPPPTSTAPALPKPEPLEAGVNPLTGLPIDEKLVNQRPIAVMINNIKASMPQIGISQADIIYECLAEGGITRLLAVFLDYDNVGTIGSVRSARDYFLDLAQIHDAIFIHAGGSDLAYSQISTRQIDHLDGVRTTVSGVFWRDAERRKTMSLEHTMVTSGEKVRQGITKMKYRTEYNAGFSSPFKFYSEVTPLDGNAATYVKIPNSSSYTAELSYDAERNLYLKNQFGTAHIDGTTKEQLAFTNVLILYTQQTTVDSYGRIGVDLTGSGRGYYIYGGKAIAINWSRSDRDGGITFTNTDGSPLKINRGKSYISIASEKIYSQTTIK